MLGDLGLLCDPGHSVDGGRYMNGKRGKRTLRRTHSRESLSSYSTVVTRPTAYAESIPTRTVYRLCSLYTKYASTSITVIFHISPLSPHFGPRLHLFISARSVEWWMKQRRACFNSSPTEGSWVKTERPRHGGMVCATSLTTSQLLNETSLTVQPRRIELAPVVPVLVRRSAVGELLQSVEASPRSRIDQQTRFTGRVSDLE